MAQLQYIGARYVPKYYQNSSDPSSSEWESGKVYEALTVVTWNDVSYTSKIPVPATVGAPDLFPAYWVKNADMPAAIHALQEEISDIKNGQLNDGVLEYSKLSDKLKNIIIDNTICVFVKNDQTDPGLANGACAIFKSKISGKVIMFDTGRREDYSCVVQTLEDNRISHIDYFILTHMHADHYGNIPNLFSDGYMDSSTIAYMPRSASWLDDWDNRLATYSAYFAHVVTISSSVPLIVDDIFFDFINCDAADYAYYESQSITQYNVYSIGAYVYINGTVIMMCGDMGNTSILHLETTGKIRHANIVNAPHHGIQQTDSYLYQRVRPEYIIAQIGMIENTHDDYGVVNGYNTSVNTYRANALGIPFYTTSYGDVYVGISDHNYSVVPSGKNVYAYVAASSSDAEYNIYVDDTYIGENLGTQDKPFNTIKEALAFAENIKVFSININVVGTYNHGDEGITYGGSSFLHIVGTEDSGPSITLLRGIFQNCRVTVDWVHFADDSARNVIEVNNAYVMLRHCVIDGDTTAQSYAYEGAAATVTSGGILRLTNGCTISNRRTIAYVENMGSVLIQNCSGSDNKLWFCTSDADTIIAENNTIAADGFIGKRSSTAGMVNNIITDKYSFADGKPATLFSGTYTTDTTESIPINISAFNDRFFIIYGGDGSIHKFYKKSNGHYSTIDEVFAATNANDPNFAIAINSNVLEITSRTYFKVVVI